MLVNGSQAGEGSARPAGGQSRRAAGAQGCHVRQAANLLLTATAQLQVITVQVLQVGHERAEATQAVQYASKAQHLQLAERHAAAAAAVAGRGEERELSWAAIQPHTDELGQLC